ncbi:13275_t:CDS:2 [Dentiscutata heterogama]|uniref:13275_t:CDS:1 n=1 Tax=Dentiscutata heterogama TaxID=1316150 RepID=A0ACA9JVJ3_9GLOM|nr:13275_t:CDS:2 [Dentiscutata heterogama]
MVAEVVDYRVSRLVVLCKDCGHDVGLYPARHKCKMSDANAPPLPSMPKQHLSSNKSNTNKQSNDNNTSEQSSATSLWSKLKTVNNWREMAEDDSVKPNVSQSTTTSAKLWDKLLSAASSAYSVIDDNSDNDSEKEDWEGETHISRILREYHQQKSGDIPEWLYDHKPIPSQNNSTKNSISSQINKIPPPNKIPAEARSMSRSRSANNLSNRIDDQRNFVPPPVPNNYDPRMHNNRPPNNYDSRFYNNNRHPNNNSSGMHSDRFNNERYNDVFGDRIVEGLNDKPNDRANMYHQRGNQLPPRLQPPSDDVAKLSSKKSQKLLRVNPAEHNRARSVSPNPSFRDRNANQPNQQSRGYRTAGYF